MDLSKLPKLSKTREHAPHVDPGGPAIAHVQQPIEYGSRQRYEPNGEGPLGLLDIFLAIGMGLLFMLLGLNYGKHLLGSTEAYPQITGTGYVWKDGHPKAGQPILPEELTPENRKGYDATVLGRRMQIVGDAALFLVGAGLLLGGILGSLGHLSVVPIGLRRAAGILGAAATTIAILYALWAAMALFRNNIIPTMTIVAILVAGLSLIMQVAAVRALMEQARVPMADLGGSSRYTGASVAGGSTAGAALSPERVVHHRFAHQSLRRAVFADPAKVVGVLQGAGGGKYLKDLWDATCRTAGVDPQSVPPISLEAEMTQVGPYSAVIVTMPPAIAQGEARYIGIVLRSYVRQDGAVIERSPLVLYYTLEIDAGAGVEGKGVLCEWHAGDHIKFADKVVEDFAPFREAMWAKVQVRQAAEDQSPTV